MPAHDVAGGKAHGGGRATTGDRLCSPCGRTHRPSGWWVLFVRWRIDIGPPAGPDYYADLRLLSGVDTLFTGRLRSAHTGQIIPGCGANQFDPNGQTLVTANSNEYRYQFLRGCISAPEQFRARATFIWDNGQANVGPVYTDYAPNGGPLPPVAFG